ncbi:MAG TPA: hypothetical protein PLW35_03990 [Verrucomicrobiota bacterium]|nr:hypothetical protein [Verrucomicrobiota bacterium]
MIRRLYFSAVILFWVTMNILLWRAEMSGQRGKSGSPVPPDLVWTRILTAPDDSSLEVYHRGRRLGHCRWWANITEPKNQNEQNPDIESIEGRVERITGYTLDLEGNILINTNQPRLRFTWHSEFGSNKAWRNMSLRLYARPLTIDVKADAAAQIITVARRDDESAWERTFTFSDLSKPDKLLGGLGLPFGGLLLSGLSAMPSGDLKSIAKLDLGLNWEAQNDWLEAGNARVRVYRLQARLFDKYHAVVHVSRVGEILRLELPGDLVLVNDAFSKLSSLR